MTRSIKMILVLALAFALSSGCSDDDVAIDSGRADGAVADAAERDTGAADAVADDVAVDVAVADDGATADAGTTACGDKQCATGTEVCVKTLEMTGAVYECKPVPASCTEENQRNCSCLGQEVCVDPYVTCTPADTANSVICECLNC
jgi:hypothetical protein